MEQIFPNTVPNGTTGIPKMLKRFERFAVAGMLLMATIAGRAYAFAGPLTITPAAPTYSVGNNVSIELFCQDGGYQPQSGYYVKDGDLPPGLVISDVSPPVGNEKRYITGSPTTVGTYNAVIGILMGSGFGEQTADLRIIITAAVAPTITSANNTTATYGTAKTFQVTATGTEPITYSFTDAPTGVSINTSTGLITIAASTVSGDYTFMITATNTAGSDTQSFVLAVNFGAVPKTGLPDIKTTTRLMLLFALLSAVLWAYVISRRKHLFGNGGA